MGLFDTIKNGALNIATNLGLYTPLQTYQAPVTPSYTSQQPTVHKSPTWAERRKAIEEEVKKNPDMYLYAYRLDPKTGSLETLPSYYNKNFVEPYLRAYKASQKYGNNAYSPDDLMAIMLQEGRTNFGFNKFHLDTAPKQAQEIYKKLMNEGHDYEEAGFAALLKEKELVAKRLGISPYRAWNGTGVNKYGQSGSEYAKKVEKTKELIQHEKNKQTRDFFHKFLSPEKRAELDSFDYTDPFGDTIA